MRITYFWLTMGYYHIARMNAIANLKDVDLHVIEATNLDDHLWERKDQNTRFTHHLMNEGEILSHKLTGRAWGNINSVLQNIDTDILVNGAGYFHPRSYWALAKWKKKQGGKLVLWSESTEADQKRFFHKEFLKKHALKVYDAAIVAGQAHKDYLIKLGVNPDAIKITGNVVENAFFEQNKIDSEREGFLFVGRLLNIKNVDGLLEAYKIYRKKNRSPQPLYIVGDGPESENLQKKIEIEQINGVILKGNLQIEQVKEMYAKCRYFVLPSHSEPWGLVVNESMASSLPVIVSDRCGCVHELVQPGKNGFIFNSESVSELAETLCKIDDMIDSEYIAMSKSSAEIISKYTPQSYAENCEKLFRKL